MSTFLVVVSYVVKAENEAGAEGKVQSLVSYGTEETASSIPPDGLKSTHISPALRVKK